MASPSSGQFGRLLEPGLRKVFFETYKEKPTKYQEVMNVLTSKKAVETDYRAGGFSLWGTKGTQDSTEYEEMLSGDPNIYNHVTFSKGFQIEKELYDDELYNVMNKRPKALARSARATIETEAAKVYNNAFSAAGYDGVPLVSAAHPRLDKGTNISNLLSGNPELTEVALEEALEMAMDMQDERGLKVQMEPTILLVPNNLHFAARKILESFQSTTAGGSNAFAKNDKNVIKGSLRIVTWAYLTNPNAWFLLDPDLLEVNFFWREKLNFKGMTDFDTDIAKYKGRMRFSSGWSDFRGVLGSNGSGA